MFNVIILLFFDCLISTSGKSWNYNTPLNIIDGEVTPIRKIPYQVSITVNDTIQLCAGSIIGEEWILSAKHCMLRHPFRTLKVRAGSDMWNKGGSIHNIVDEYTPPNKDADIVLWKVQPAFIFDQSRQLVQLPEPNYKIIPRTMGIISGWGDTDNSGNSPSLYLKSVEIPIVKRNRCQRELSPLMYIQDDEICAGYLTKEGGKNFCDGDSGGPLVIDGKLIGIINRSVNCGESYKPHVFTNVVFYRNWIKKITNIS